MKDLYENKFITTFMLNGGANYLNCKEIFVIIHLYGTQNQFAISANLLSPIHYNRKILKRLVTNFIGDFKTFCTENI